MFWIHVIHALDIHVTRQRLAHITMLGSSHGVLCELAVFCSLHGSCFELHDSCYDVLSRTTNLFVLQKKFIRFKPTTDHR